MKSKRKPAFFVHLLYGMIAGLLIGISAITVFLVQDRLRQPATIDTGHFKVESEAGFDGVIRIQPPINVADFTLINQDGNATSLRDLRGRYVLLTFGFTNCPDICPLTLSDFQRVNNMLDDHSEQMAFVFISVDGQRDTPAALRSYLSFRGMESIIGLTGDEKDVREIGAPFGLSFEVIGDASTGAYSVNHTAGSFLLDPQGRWIMRYQFGVPPDKIAAQLNELL